MHCMKCGRETSEERAFCDECLAGMAKYPVKPGTAVQLPRRRDLSSVRRTLPRRKTLTPEEQIRKLRKSQRTLFIMWLVTFVLFCALLYPAVSYILEGEHFRPGQNYSLIDSLLPTEME